jgi:hypothetical protein
VVIITFLAEQYNENRWSGGGEMEKTTVVKIIAVTALALAAAALFQELAKPPGERSWRGKLAGVVPYDFRLPTWDRFKESFWNPYERHLLTPAVFGAGWAFNFYGLLENLGFVHQPGGSEEDFLMPTRSLREVLKNGKAGG